MDGVLADFIGGACRVHGRDSQAVLQGWPRGEAHVDAVLGMTLDVFWRRIDAEGTAFWEGLAPYPWFGGLLGWLESTGLPWHICSSPSRSPASAAGKMAWLYQHVHPRMRDFALTPRKELLARPGVVLIDDNERFVSRFKAAGGEALLFPQPWNHLGAVADPVGRLRRRLVTRVALSS